MITKVEIPKVSLYSTKLPAIILSGGSLKKPTPPIQDDENIGDILYIDQRDGSTQLVSGDINGTELQKIQNSVRHYRAKNLGNGEVIVAETTESKNQFVANGQQIPVDQYDVYGDSFVQIAVPISFKCVEIEEDLFRLQWLAGHKPNSSWKECPTDKILFGSNFMYDKYSQADGYPTSRTYDGWSNVCQNRGEGYSMFKYCFTAMFKGMALSVFGGDIFNVLSPYDFCGMSRIVGPIDGGYQEIVESEIIPNGNTATLYTTDVEGNPYNVEMQWATGIVSGRIKKLALSENLDIVVKQYGNGLYRSYCWYGGTGAPRRIYNNGGNEGIKNVLFGLSFENAGDKVKPCRLMFQGKINYTEDIDYFLSLPNK